MDSDLPPNLRPTTIDSNVIRRLLEDVERRQNPDINGPEVKKSIGERMKEWHDERTSFDPKNQAKSRAPSDSSAPNTGSSDSKKLLKGFIIFIVIIIVIALILYVVNRQKAVQARLKEEVHNKDDIKSYIKAMRASDFSRNTIIIGELIAYLLGVYGIIRTINLLVKVSCETVD